MATEVPGTKAALIWQIAMSIARSENRASDGVFHSGRGRSEGAPVADRAYLVSLFTDAAQTVHQLSD
ncbi:hypothetical protein AA13595_0048 [Gluconacetobacter johannae DSM 13595]|nr:hypothetical protein AA13595_0048 [Gluconacetobacter johannae DSM 13595]